MKKGIVGHGEVGLKLLEVLGLTGQSVISVDIHVAVGEAVTAKVEMYISKEEYEECLKIFRAYKWEEMEEAGEIDETSIREDIAATGGERSQCGLDLRGRGAGNHRI